MDKRQDRIADVSSLVPKPVTVDRLEHCRPRYSLGIIARDDAHLRLRRGKGALYFEPTRNGPGLGEYLAHDQVAEHTRQQVPPG